MKKKLIVLLILCCTLLAVFAGCTTVVNADTLDLVEADKAAAGDSDAIGEYKSVLMYEKFGQYTALTKPTATEDEAVETTSDVYLSETWTAYSAGTANTSSVKLVDGEGITLTTTTSGYASLQTKIDVKAGGYYKLIYTYSTTAMSATDGESYRGLWIGFAEDANFNDGTDEAIVEETEKKTLQTRTIYFHTNNIRQLTLSVNLGALDYEVSASATLYRVVLTEVSQAIIAATEGGEIDYTSYVKEVTPTVYDLSSVKNTVYVALGAILIALIMYCAYVAYSRYSALKNTNSLKSLIKTLDEKKNAWISLLIVAVTAFIVRILPAVLVSIVGSTHADVSLGYESDTLVKYATSMANSGGTVYFFTYNQAALLEPLKLMLLAIVGWMGSGWTETLDIFIATSFFLRFVAILADIGCIIIIFLLIKKRVGNVGAAIMALAYSLLPVFFATTAVWTSLTSVAAMLILLTFYFVIENKYIGVAISFFIACMFSVLAIFMAPVVICYTVREFIKRKNLRIPIIVSMLSGFVLFYLLSLPFTYLDVAAGNAMGCFKLYFQAFIGNQVYVSNAFNFQMLLGNNMAEISSASIVIDVIFAIFAISLAAVAYFKSPNRLDVSLVAVALTIMLFEFGNRMSPEVLLFVLPLLFVYALVSQDKRVFFAAVALMILNYVNIAYVYGMVEYTSNVAPQVLYEDGMAYTFSVFNLILVLYFVYLVYDITIEQKTMLMRPLEIKWTTLWVFRLKKIGAAFVAVAKAIGVFFKTVFSKPDKAGA